MLTRYVAARLRDRDTVDDLVQEAFCTALASPDLLGEDLLGSKLRLAARAVTRHCWIPRTKMIIDDRGGSFTSVRHASVV